MTEEECVRMATETAMPTHNHPESIKGAVATALAIFHLKNGRDKDFVRENVLNEYYPEWANKKYDEFHDEYSFYSTCAGTVGPAIICFLESKDYVDCIKLAISLGGDADTLAAIAGPMAYAYYRSMPDTLVYQALKKLPEWMVDVSERFDDIVNGGVK
jgi:ADP-ribosylglycohydrolase